LIAGQNTAEAGATGLAMEWYTVTVNG